MNTKDKITIFESPQDDTLTKIYELYLELSRSPKTKVHKSQDGGNYYTSLDDLKRKPTKRWYSKLNKLIEAYGHENYRNHVKFVLEHMIVLQRGSSLMERKMKSDKKRQIYKPLSEYLNEGELWKYYDRQPPTAYYFYCSDKARYFRGIVYSVSSVPDPLLLDLLKDFALVYPFQSAPVSQAPTGLFTYDIMEVFSKLEVDKAVGYLFALKNRIKAKYFQKKVQALIKKLAKQNDISEHELVEMGIADFGLNENGRLELSVGNYSLFFEFVEFGKENIWWKNNDTQKTQKSVPKNIKEDHPEKNTYLKKYLKDLKLQIEINAKRIESYYYEDREWDYSSWKINYQQHRLVGLLANTLVWMFKIDGVFHQGVIDDGKIVLADGVRFVESECEKVKLWHPVIDSLRLDILTFIQSRKQCFKQVEREIYRCGFIIDQSSKSMNKNILAQLYKARGWSYLYPTIKRKVVPRELEVLIELKDVNDGTRGRYSGSNTTRITAVEFRKNNDKTECNEVNEVVYSELARDVDLFVQKAGLT